MSSRWRVTPVVACRAESDWVLLPTDDPAWPAFQRAVDDPDSGVNPNVARSARTFTDHGQQLWAMFKAGRASVTVREETDECVHVA